MTKDPEQLINILLVDDDARNLEALEGLLQSADYNLVSVQTAQDALRSLIDREFAVIVLDIQMPTMNGIELANLIKRRSRTQHVPIIFLTAYHEDDRMVLEGYGSGAVDYLTKPINAAILQSKIAVFADLFRKSRALAREIGQREAAEKELREINNQLEARVKERVSDLVRLNDELALARDKALAASRAKDEFLARLSHELRTPLNPVLLVATDAANDSTLSSKIRADFEMVAANVALEARLIDDLLDVTLIARGKLSLEARPLDFHILLRDGLGMVKADLSAKNIDLALNLAAYPHDGVGDDVRLKQIFWNVLKNAVKFTPSGGSISLGTQADPSSGRIKVTISDNGIGMTPSEIDRAFESFSQGDHAVVDSPHRFGGLGIGLALSRMLVELHSGSIQAMSAGRDQGTTFVIDLPLRLVAASLPQDGEPPPTPDKAEAKVGAGRILLVEDHQPTAASLKRLLTNRNYAVASASTLGEARQLARAGKFDILISDIGLPDGNGCDLMTELKGRPELTGIALTGYGMEDDVSRTLAAGFSIHLTKPVSAQTLDRALRGVRQKP